MAHILVVEDDALLASMLGTELSHDYTITKVPDGTFVMDAIQHDRPDLILLDLFMPSMDGFAVLQELKKDQSTATIPVLVLTNLGGQVEIDRARSLGARDVLVKADYSLEELHKKIDEFCKPAAGSH